MGKILFISWLFDAGIAIATECWNGDLPFTNQIRQFFRSSQHKTQVSLWIWIKPAHYIAHHKNTSGTQIANMELRRNNYQIILFSLGSSICSLPGKIKYCVSPCNDFLLHFFSSHFVIKLTLGVKTHVLKEEYTGVSRYEKYLYWAFFLCILGSNCLIFTLKMYIGFFNFKICACWFSLDCRYDLPFLEKIRMLTFNWINFMSTVGLCTQSVKVHSQGVKAFIRWKS